MPTPCCYTSLLEPLPGTGFSTGPGYSGEEPFCHEPDHGDVQEEQAQGVVGGGGGGGGGQYMTSSQVEKRRNNNNNNNNNNSTLLRTPDGRPVGIDNADLHDLSPEVKIASSLPTSTIMMTEENPQQTCDKLLWPRDKSRMARLNVTMSSDWNLVGKLGT